MYWRSLSARRFLSATFLRGPPSVDWKEVKGANRGAEEEDEEDEEDEAFLFLGMYERFRLRRTCCDRLRMASSLYNEDGPPNVVANSCTLLLADPACSPFTRG